MGEFWEFFEHALLDTLKVLPFIFAVYVIIEFVEGRIASTGKKSLLAGKYAPFLGAATGLIPQCGFSVMAAKLYDKKMITTGTLIAVFLATSDEAVVLLITSGEKIGFIIPLLAIKLLFGGFVGFAVNAFMKEKTVEYAHCEEDECHCGHNHHAKPFEKYILHPLKHTAIIFIFVLIVNLAFEAIVHAIGKDTLVGMLEKGAAFQPLLAAVVGLIPSCAASVIITQGYIVGGISFGSCVAGLCVNAGLGYAVILKNKENLKKNLILIGFIFVMSVLLGYLIDFVCSFIL